MVRSRGEENKLAWIESIQSGKIEIKKGEIENALKAGRLYELIDSEYTPGTLVWARIAVIQLQEKKSKDAKRYFDDLAELSEVKAFIETKLDTTTMYKRVGVIKKTSDLPRMIQVMSSTRAKQAEFNAHAPSSTRYDRRRDALLRQVESKATARLRGILDNEFSTFRKAIPNAFTWADVTLIDEGIIETADLLKEGVGKQDATGELAEEIDSVKEVLFDEIESKRDELAILEEVRSGQLLPQIDTKGKKLRWLYRVGAIVDKYLRATQDTDANILAVQAKIAGMVKFVSPGTKKRTRK